MNKKEFVPALRYGWLTKIFDPFLNITMPERKFKSILIEHAAIMEYYNVDSLVFKV